ncbi:MAG: hypothetical protein ACI9WU_001918 [Myxococcota bacterium]|jgi:hypothetical protein
MADGGAMPAGRRLGRYELLEPIGQGGIGRVWRASTVGKDGKPLEVALKLLLPGMQAKKRILEMFLQEARLCAGMVHPNIARIVDWGQADEQWYIAMELVKGHDLRQILVHTSRLGATLPLGYSLFMARATALGLHYAHEATDDMGDPLGIVHMDVSPANLLIGKDGAVKLTDFGMARSHLEEPAAFGRRSVRGKLAYMSPEQIDGLPLDRRSDIFALGTVLYEVITVERLWRRQTVEETAAAVREADLESRLAGKPIPASLAAVLRNCLAHDREDRYPDCATLVRDLDAVVRTEGAGIEAADMGVALHALCRRSFARTGPVGAVGSLFSWRVPSVRKARPALKLQATVDMRLGDPTARGNITTPGWLQVTAKLALRSSTGRLRAIYKGRIRDVFFRNGKMTYATTEDATEELVRHLIERGKVDQKKAAAAWDNATNKDRDVAGILLEAGLVDPLTITASLERLQLRRWAEPMTWAGGPYEWYEGHRAPPYVVPVLVDGLEALGRLMRKSLKEKHVTRLLTQIGVDRSPIELVEPAPFGPERIRASGVELRLISTLRTRPMALRVLLVGQGEEERSVIRRFVLLMLVSGLARTRTP